MLEITVVTKEGLDEDNNFVSLESFQLELEHSLVSLSKWESKWNVPFISDDPKTTEQVYDYIRMMTLTSDVPEEVYQNLSQQNIDDINEYIASKQTATWFRETPHDRPDKPVITAEIIYYWMVSMQIDWQAQYWHLNRLLTLVRVINEKNAPPKKQSKSQMLADRAAAMRAARARHNPT